MRHSFLLGVLGIVALNLTQPLRGSTSTTGNIVGQFQAHHGPSKEEKDEADVIIRRSYANSYAHLLPCDDGDAKSPAGISELWNPNLWMLCMKKNLIHFNEPAVNASSADHRSYTGSTPSIPWWLQTLLRDAQKNGAYGSWHHFSTTAPPLHFCSIEKVATTEWRKIFCVANADDCIRDPKQCGKNRCAWRTTKAVPDDAPWAVFLRDPLERLLSGFLNKCYTATIRKGEKHCEPNIVFNARPNMTDEKKKKYPSLMDHLEGKDKQMFAAYLDVLPLQWNVHFVPQAIVCNLHQNIGSYAFVGNMGQDFAFEIERMANQFGGPLPELLNASFGYVENVKAGKKNIGKDDSGHATYAPGKVRQFYTAQTVRRGLELMSIDYVTLGLKVPEWARQMLRDDVS